MHFGKYSANYEAVGQYPRFWPKRKCTFHFPLNKSYDIKKVRATINVSEELVVLNIQTHEGSKPIAMKGKVK